MCVCLAGGTIKRVKGSRWTVSIPSVSANELARFTASIQRTRRMCVCVSVCVCVETRLSPKTMFE